MLPLRLYALGRTELLQSTYAARVAARFRLLNTTSGEPSKQSVEESSAAQQQRPQYATKRSYDQQVKSERAQRVATESTGVRPGKFKRFFLVATGLYSRVSDVPEYVPMTVITKLGDRLRIVFIVTAVLIFFTLFYTSELRIAKRIERERAASSGQSSRS